MPNLPDFPPSNSTSKEVEAWEQGFFDIIEELSVEYEVCDEESLVSEMRKIDDSVTENDISEYTIKFHPEGSFLTPEQVNSIESGLEGTCLRTDGPDIFWEDVDGVPTGPWKGSIALLGPPLRGKTFEEVQEESFWDSFDSALNNLIEVCEDNGVRIVYPQDIGIGTTVWAGENLIGGIAFTLDED
jgi:hypothetical protein